MINLLLLLLKSPEMKHLPNFITCLNLASGFLAILFAWNGNLLTASWLIAGAMVFDFLDGFAARLLGAYSDLGKELDSLADIVSFGIAPALIVYSILSGSGLHIQPGDGTALNPLAALISVIMPVCAGLRLAKFNTDSEQTTSFRGLPTPANAIAVISLVIAGAYSDLPALRSFTDSAAAISVYSLVLSVLMVTRIPLLSLKVSNLRVKGNEGRYILAGLVLVSFIILGIAAAPLIIPFYIAASWTSPLFRTAV